MARTAASIQSEIDAIEARLSSADGLVRSVGSDGSSVTYEDRSKLEVRLDKLYQMLGRANGSNPMFVRGHVDGLRG